MSACIASGGGQGSNLSTREVHGVGEFPGRDAIPADDRGAACPSACRRGLAEDADRPENDLPLGRNLLESAKSL